MQIAIRGNVTEPFDLFAWGRPVYLQFVDASCLADSKDFTRVMRGKIAAAVILQTRPCLSACLPDDPCANCIAIAGYAFQFQSKPIISGGRVVLEEKWSTPIYANNHIQGAVVVIIAYRKTACGKVLLKRRSAVFTHIVQFAILFLVVKQQRFFIFHL